MASKKGKNLSLSFSPEEVIGAEIMKSGDYRYASVGIKKGDDERCRISYEWSGETIPDFVMALMSWMSANEEVIEENKNEEEYASLKERQ